MRPLKKLSSTAAFKLHFISSESIEYIRYVFLFFMKKSTHADQTSVTKVFGGTVLLSRIPVCRCCRDLPTKRRLHLNFDFLSARLIMSLSNRPSRGVLDHLRRYRSQHQLPHLETNSHSTRTLNPTIIAVVSFHQCPEVLLLIPSASSSERSCTKYTFLT